jgi:hypothetical protein
MYDIACQYQTTRGSPPRRWAQAERDQIAAAAAANEQRLNEAVDALQRQVESELAGRINLEGYANELACTMGARASLVARHHCAAAGAAAAMMASGGDDGHGASELAREHMSRAARSATVGVAGSPAGSTAEQPDEMQAGSGQPLATAAAAGAWLASWATGAAARAGREKVVRLGQVAAPLLRASRMQQHEARAVANAIAAAAHARAAGPAPRLRDVGVEEQLPRQLPSADGKETVAGSKDATTPSPAIDRSKWDARHARQRARMARACPDARALPHEPSELSTPMMRQGQPAAGVTAWHGGGGGGGSGWHELASPAFRSAQLRRGGERGGASEPPCPGHIGATSEGPVGGAANVVEWLSSPCTRRRRQLAASASTERHWHWPTANPSASSAWAITARAAASHRVPPDRAAAIDNLAASSAPQRGGRGRTPDAAAAAAAAAASIEEAALELVVCRRALSESWVGSPKPAQVGEGAWRRPPPDLGATAPACLPACHARIHPRRPVRQEALTDRLTG